MNNVQTGALDLVPGTTNSPMPANGVRISPIGGRASISTDGTTFSPVDLFACGTNLGDASATINPASDNASEYTLPAGTLSANRTLTLGVTGSPVTGTLVQISRRDLTAHTYTVQDDASTSLVVFGSAPAGPQGASFRFNGTHFVLSGFFYLAG